MKRAVLFACLVALGGPEAPAQADSYDGALRKARSSSGAAQMAAAVMSNGRLVWSGAAGKGARASDVYSLASLTKTYVAAAVLRLAARGRLALSDRVGRWLGRRVPAAAGRVTVRELLAHTSGLPEYLDDAHVLEALEDPRHRWTEAELLRAVRAPRRRGTFTYSNTNYLLAGAIMRRAAGRDPGRVLAAEITRPLGLRSTSLTRSARLARRVAGRRRLPNDVWGPLWTDGGVVSSAPDVARFLDALLGRRVLVAPQLDAMLPAAGDYGLGIYGVTLLGRSAFGHDGTYGGWESYGLGFPASGTTVVVLAHGGATTGPGRAVRALASVASGNGLL